MVVASDERREVTGDDQKPALAPHAGIGLGSGAVGEG